MTEKLTSTWRADRLRSRAFLSALIALLLIRLVLMAWLPLTDTTEARYAEIARKMLETGDWITPQFDYGVPFWGKPPLQSWVTAIGMKFFGINAFAARLPILLTAVGVLAMIHLFTRNVASGTTPVLAVAICASSVLFFGASAFVMTDMVMIFGTTLSMVAFYLSVAIRPKDNWWGHLFFAGIAIGLLAKGPTALVLTALPCGLWLLFAKRAADLKRLPWFTGTALMLVLVCPWYIAAETATPGFLRYFLIGEHVERFLIPGWDGDLYGTGHREPKGMIWLFALGVFLPWTPLMALLAARSQTLRDEIRNGNLSVLTYLGLWICSPLILFTPAANILPAYVLPAVPAFSILLSVLIAEHWKGNDWLPMTVAASLIVAMAFFLAVTLTSRYAPAMLGLRNMATLVATAKAHVPHVEISVYRSRSYSAEFYTFGTAKTLTNSDDLLVLAANAKRDALILPNGRVAEVTKALGTTFHIVLSDHRNSLLIEESQ